MKDSASYLMFASFFRKQTKPDLKDYVLHAAHLKDAEPNWSNNNCESLNHIMKSDAKWKPGNTPQIITLLHDIVALHFKDCRRALYGSENYRLVKNQRTRFNVPKDTWRKLNDEDKSAKFKTFLKNQYKRKPTTINSTYANFVATKLSTAQKPGQKKRVRIAKTIKK